RHCRRRCRAACLGGRRVLNKIDRLCLGDHDPGLGHRRRADLLGGANHPASNYVTSLSPTIPATMSPMLARRAAVAGSPNNAMPRIAVPTAPIPVHTA